MKQIKIIYTLLLAVALPLLTACTFGDEIIENGTEQKDGKVTVRFRVSQAAPVTTRAEDKNAEDKEMMNIWTVVAVKENNVVWVQTCQPTGDEKEIDDLVQMETGDYVFYSFANIGASYIENLFGLNEGTIPTPPSDNTPVSKTLESPVDISSKDIDNAAAKAIGNNFDAFEKNDTEGNGFGSYGIPMSNKQTIPINADTDVDLIVVRMLAKIKLEIKNSGAEPVTITSIAITDITENGDNRLKLFPQYTNSNNANTMEPVHGDIQPNLNGNPKTEEMTVSVDETIGKEETKDITFYINESQTPTSDPKNNYKHFFLKINLSKNNGSQTEERYTLIDDSNADNDDTGEWNYIARNDYRIIPIVLNDYKLEMIPYDFPAIGVYPASVKEEDGLYTITFHDYGHFHLLPKVTMFTESETKDVNYGTGWTLSGGSFKTAWKSWNDHTKASDGNVAKFYASGDVANGDGSAKIDDEDDKGGQPVWYLNDASKPQWSPTGSTPYEPFIFGYIADPKNKPETGGNKVYHEFTIIVNTNHLLTYRLYMILDTEQMLYSRRLGAPAARHTHGH